ncbi:hypothetical protein HHI36_000112 [Cryptolaemus montrouzieri]|uniref:Reverse transcriptase domain-containing protein n=1 Tax=Cryptolaemus montrouzieri TaxID=559131 RepID=A0ABD2P4B9_9CUCU
MGISIGNEHLFTLSFADDQVVLAQDLEFMIKILYDTYKQWGLQVSLKKTEYSAVNTDANFEVLINDEVAVKQVKCFKYLGALIDSEGLRKEEVKARIRSSKKIIGCLSNLW